MDQKFSGGLITLALIVGVRPLPFPWHSPPPPPLHNATLVRDLLSLPARVGLSRLLTRIRVNLSRELKTSLSPWRATSGEGRGVGEFRLKTEKFPRVPCGSGKKKTSEKRIELCVEGSLHCKLVVFVTTFSNFFLKFWYFCHHVVYFISSSSFFFKKIKQN